MDISFLLLLFLLLPILLILHKKNSCPTQTNFTPLHPYPVLGNIPHIFKNRSRLLDWASDLIPLSPTFTSTVSPFIFTANPSNIKHILHSNFDNYPKGGFVSSAMHDFLGHGIFNSNGPLWRLQRKTASFEFNTKSIRSFIFDIVLRETIQVLVPILDHSITTNKILDLQDLLERFAFDNICNLAFGYNPESLATTSDEGLRFFHAFDEASHIVVERIGSTIPWQIKKLLNVGSEKRFRHSQAIVHEMVSKFVRLRRKQDDLLSRFADDPSNSDELLRDISINFMIAGRDTTPTALTWFFWILSSRPRIVKQILEEIKSVREKKKNNNKDEFFEIEELREMHYLHAALSETMRLYPPVPLLLRVAVKDDVLPDGTGVKKGWYVMYNSYVMGRMKSLWGEDCMEVRPERWLVDGVYRPVSSYKYPVFHGGPRVCLGKEMAYIQMKAVVACVLERFEIEVVEERGEAQLSMTMRMKGGLPVRVKHRNS
ncbi:Cytochrome P450 E-class group I protein [Dioscorea alata]|uniref:Cytochrome P450 E-class group I protein n=1 Tax=Dioscorea alata TaxID=55571 RepID=A0ACB7V6L7_DIOAL|nr:Cytochrome P450 E-class group I protein [Dioscorea alata]